MYDAGSCFSYSLAVFAVVLLSGCAVNLLRQHFIFQLTGIAFFFTYSVFKTFDLINNDPGISVRELYLFSLPMLAGVSACLVSMVLGFWIFPLIRKKIKS